MTTQINIKDIIACQTKNWYPIFQSECFRTEFLTLPENVVEWLQSDGTFVLVRID